MRKLALVRPSDVREGTRVYNSVRELRKVLQPGDIIATKTNNEAAKKSTLPDFLATKVIEFAGGSPWSHTAIYKGKGKLIHTTPKTSTEPMVHDDDIENVLSYGRDLLVLRPEKIDKIRRAESVKRMESLRGTGYSWGDIASVMAPWAVSQGSNYAKKPDGATCTHTNAWAYPDLKFDRPIRSLAPKHFVEHKDLRQVAAFSSDNKNEKEKKAYFQGVLGPASVTGLAGNLAGGFSARQAGGSYGTGALPGSLLGGVGGGLSGAIAEAVAKRFGVGAGRAAQLATMGGSVIGAALTGRQLAMDEIAEQKRKERDIHLQRMAVGVQNARRWQQGV